MSYFWKPEGAATDFEQQLATSQYDPGAWWHFKTQAGRAFDLYNTMGLAIHEGHVAQEEQRAGVYDASSNRALSGFYPGEARPEPQREKTISREEFLRQGYDRGGRIEWSPRTTEVRARIEAEELDKRDHEDMLLERTGTPFRSAMGFGAAFLGSLPDPINLLPVGGAAARGASLGRRVLSGAKAGAVGTALADAVVLPSARARGEDVGFGTMALDMTFGALIGGGIGGAGAFFHGRRVRSMAAEEESLAKAFSEAGFDAGEASRRAHDVVNVLADTAHRTEKAEAVRSWLGGQNREDAGRLLDKAMEVLVRGEDMDVASWAALLRGQEVSPGESLLPRGVAPTVQRDFAQMLSAVEKEGVPTVNFGTLSPDRLAALRAVERSGGMDILRDGRLVLPSNVVWSLFSKGKGILSGHHTADQLADALLDAIRFDRGAPVQAGEKARAKRLGKMQNKLLESGFLERDKDTGKVRINAETSIGAERKRLIEEMVGAGEDRQRAGLYANLHTAQALAFQKAYGVDAVKALKRRAFFRSAEGLRLRGASRLEEGGRWPAPAFITESEAARLDAAQGSRERQGRISAAKDLYRAGEKDGRLKSEAERKKLEEEIYSKTKARRDADGNWTIEEKTAAQKLEEDVAAWEKHVDEVKERFDGIDRHPILKQTPAVFHLVGADFSELRVDGHIFDGKEGITGEVRGNHHVHPEINSEVLKKLPRALTNPIAVFNYRLPRTGRIVPKSFIVMLNIPMDDGGTIMTALRIKGYRDGRATVNYLETAFERAYQDSGLPNNNFFERLIRETDPEKQSLCYINTGLYNTWRAGWGQLYGLSSTIPPLVLPERVKTQADLVNVRKEYPTFYQDAPAGAQAPVQESQADAVNRLFQEAWHGTPYTFDRFTLDHVGTGEGAQAHGHGLYFAAGRDVAEGYRQRLSGKGAMRLLVDGVEYLGEAVDALTHSGNGVVWRDAAGDFVPEEFVQHLNYLYRKARTGELDADYVSALKEWATGEGLTQDQRALLERFSREYESAELSAREEQGQLYRVEIPDNDVLLVEENRFENQPQTVKEALAAAGKELGVDVTGSGREVYEAISRALGGAEEASRWLNEHGVKGITYEGQRDGRCFVVFDDQAIQIYETLYQAKMQAQAGDAGPRGMVDFSSPEPGSMEETYRIFLSPEADASTIPHESAHVFYRELENVVASAKEGGVNVEQARADLRALRRNAGVAEEGKLSADDYRKVQEATARSFEQYLAEGRAPNAALEGVFQRMARWLSSIYEDIKAYVAGTDGVELKDEVRQAFDRMLAPDRWNAAERMDELRMEGPRPDYSRPAPLPEVRPDSVEALEKASDEILSDIGRAPVDLEAARIVDSGGASPEHLAELEAANGQLERIDKIEEASLAALECIIGGAA